MDTLTLADVYQGLTAPFAPQVIELKPGAVTKDKTKALALAYADRCFPSPRWIIYWASLDQFPGRCRAEPASAPPSDPPGRLPDRLVSEEGG